MNLLVTGTSGPLTGEIVVPNSKYHAHRALILASLAPGTSRIVGLSDARHVEFTMDVLRALGTTIECARKVVLRKLPSSAASSALGSGAPSQRRSFDNANGASRALPAPLPVQCGPGVDTGDPVPAPSSRTAS